MDRLVRFEYPDSLGRWQGCKAKGVGGESLGGMPLMDVSWSLFLETSDFDCLILAVEEALLGFPTGCWREKYSDISMIWGLLDAVFFSTPLTSMASAGLLGRDRNFISENDRSGTNHKALAVLHIGSVAGLVLTHVRDVLLARMHVRAQTDRRQSWN